MFKRIRPISLILLAGAFSFPKSAWAEPTIVGESLNISQQSGKCLEGVKKGDIIVISFIGYTTQEIPYTGQSSLQVKLVEDTQKLDEVVVVGFGTQKKVNLTGSVGTVNSEALESRPVMSATQALQGMVPGLQISSSSGSLEKTADIQVRGTATIGEGSSGSPLVLMLPLLPFTGPVLLSV